MKKTSNKSINIAPIFSGFGLFLIILGIIAYIVGSYQSQSFPTHQEGEFNVSISYIILILGFLLFIIGIVYMLYKPKKHVDNDAINILNRRYAKGKITKEELDKMKKDIEG